MSALDGIRQRADDAIAFGACQELCCEPERDGLRLLAAVDAILALHRREPLSLVDGQTCAECGDWWPCPTVAAVNDALEAGE